MKNPKVSLAAALIASAVRSAEREAARRQREEASRHQDLTSARDAHEAAKLAVDAALESVSDLRTIAKGLTK